jgi:hypothetical protein
MVYSDKHINKTAKMSIPAPYFSFIYFVIYAATQNVFNIFVGKDIETVFKLTSTLH